MSEPVRYVDLPLPEQAKLLHGLAFVLGRRAEILEKDIWLCQVLGLLFALPVLSNDHGSCSHPRG